MSKKKFTIRGKTYDLDDAADLVSVQNQLVPDNWRGRTKADCVRLFLNTQAMLTLQLQRHLAANWKTICQVAGENGSEDASNATVGLAFGFTLNQSAPSVVAIEGIKFGGSQKFGTTGQPVTFDTTQGEFFDDDMSVVFNTKSLEEEKAENAKRAAAEKEAKAKEKADAEKIVPMDSTLPPPDANGDVTPESEPPDAPSGVDKKKPRRKK